MIPTLLLFFEDDDTEEEDLTVEDDCFTTFDDDELDDEEDELVLLAYEYEELAEPLLCSAKSDIFFCDLWMKTPDNLNGQNGLLRIISFCKHKSKTYKHDWASKWENALRFFT